MPRSGRWPCRSSSRIARGPWATAGRTHTTWYQPLEAPGGHRPGGALGAGIPDVFINTVGDLALLPRVLDAASRPSARPSDEEMAAHARGDRRMTSLFGLPA